jgi:hypothetical protein
MSSESVASSASVPTAVTGSCGTPTPRAVIDVPATSSPAPSGKARPRHLLSQRVFALQQIVPLIHLATVMFYEATSHLIFETSSHGLGLRIARTLAEKDLHGRIALTSTVDGGTVAWVLFQRGIVLAQEE